VASKKRIESKLTYIAFACSDVLAYDTGTDTQTENGKSVEGNYLVVLCWKDGKRLIVQHASTAKQRLK